MTYRCALITGASSGIGEAFARALPKSTSLLLTGRDRAKLAHLASELANAERTVRSVAADLATVEGRQAVIGFAEGQPVDLLVNNAGVGHLGRVVDNPPERELEMAQLNMVAPVELTRALLPGLLKRSGEGRRGGLIFVASAAAFMPIPLFATYAASKAFLLHYAEALAEELSDYAGGCPGALPRRHADALLRARQHDANSTACTKCTMPTGWRARGCRRWATGWFTWWGRPTTWRRRRPASCPAGSSPRRPSGPCGGGSNPRSVNQTFVYFLTGCDDTGAATTPRSAEKQDDPRCVETGSVVALAEVLSAGDRLADRVQAAPALPPAG